MRVCACELRNVPRRRRVRVRARRARASSRTSRRRRRRLSLHVVDGAIARCRSPGGENVLVVDSVPFEHTKLVLCVDVHYRAVGGTHCDLASATLLCVESEWGDFLPVHQPVERLREYRRSELVDDDDATWPGVDAAVRGIARDLRARSHASFLAEVRARPAYRARAEGAARARVARAPCADAVIRRASAGCGSDRGSGSTP